MSLLSNFLNPNHQPNFIFARESKLHRLGLNTLLYAPLLSDSHCILLFACLSYYWTMSP